MWNLQDIIWVVPGVVFIFLYNRRVRLNHSIRLSGWSYVFFLVGVAAVTWLPAESIIQASLPNQSSELSIWATLLILLISTIFSIILLWLCTVNENIEDWLFLSIRDNFYNKCIELENKEILLTLKNKKAYHGILWKYPKNPESKCELQTISIVPFKSGYRDKKNKEVIWNIYYPEPDESNKAQMDHSELFIPRSEIVTFGQYSKNIAEGIKPILDTKSPFELEIRTSK